MNSFYDRNRAMQKANQEERKEMQFAQLEVEHEDFFNENMEHLARVHKDSMVGNPEREDQV